MNTDLWNEDIWKKHFAKNMIIVCTAEVLLQCLQKAFIRMEGINLLIFDEAHHAKKDHPYARYASLRPPFAHRNSDIFQDHQRMLQESPRPC
jgi:ERCC4-related helicase